jgi:UDP-glucose 4-epimerase
MSGKHRITIVGGSGFIGSALAERLSEEFRVRIVDMALPPPKLRKKVDFYHCDIRKLKPLERALQKTEVVIHTAIIQIPKINEEKRLAYEVNVLGTQNVCATVETNDEVKGMILASSWHLFGEHELRGVIDESFGFRPDKVEERAKLYAISKMAQEAIVKFYDSMSEKVYGTIRMGTVLGQGMPEKAAASIFINQALSGKTITPFAHSMHRPMLYVDISDVCKAFHTFVVKIIRGEMDKNAHVINVCYPKPITILDLAVMIRELVIELSHNKIKPEIQVVDRGVPSLFSPSDKKLIRVSLKRVMELGLRKMTPPRESLRRIIAESFSLSRGYVY